MELVNITEAARLAGVSEKTLRRAINKYKTLETQPHVTNQPIMIAVPELERYIASRQVQASTPAQPSGNDPGLAELARNRMDDLTMRLATLEEQHLLTQEALVREQHRISELERALQETQDMVIKLSNHSHSNAVPAQPAQKENSTPVPAQPDKTIFDLANFSQLLLHEYRSSATRGDVKAWLTLRPEPQGVKGDYRIDYLACGKADGKRGAMGREQQARGEQLKSDLRAKVRMAAFQAGWQKGPYDIFVCPVDQGKQQ